ncbi:MULTISPECIES: hypothetical protein [Bacillus]|uniref:hypothetical protein n=1 Tax=Bacillus TaxID=1386 RepID=UPI000307AA86|nr:MULTISPECIES: hypothetical protein [Bacillus]
MMSRGSIRGFATGLLIATIVLGSLYYIDEKKQEQPMTYTQLKAASQKLGYKLVKTDEEPNKNHSVKKEPKTPSNSNNNQNDSVSKQAKSYTLAVNKGMKTEEICQTLQLNHIIDDAIKFDQYLSEHDFSKKVQIGKFVLTSEMSYEQIARIITKIE